MHLKSLDLQLADKVIPTLWIHLPKLFSGLDCISQQN